MKLFKEKSVTDLFITNENKIGDRVESLSNEEILELSSKELGESISAKYKIDFKVEIDFENPTIETKMEDLSGQKHISPITRCLNAIVYYSFPISKNPAFLQYSPHSENSIQIFRSNRVDGIIKGNNLIIKISTTYANPNLPDNLIQEVKKAILDKVEKIKNNLQALKSECDEYNEKIYERVVKFIEVEKDRIEKENAQKSKLNPFK